MRFGAALLVCLIAVPASAQEFATVTTNAPIYAEAREAPTPVRVAAVGTRLRVVSRTEGDWVQVEYNDPQLGRRTGWVLVHYISLTSTDLRPMDLSVPEAKPGAPTPIDSPAVPADSAAVPTLPPMPSAPSFPRWETSLGWSFLRSKGEFLEMNSAVGWNVSIAGNVSPYVGIVGDVTASYKSGLTAFDDSGVTLYAITGGPRFSARNESAATPFAEFLVGFTRTTFDVGGFGDSSFEFTIQPGGGVDIGNDRAAARFSVAWRRVFYEGSPTNMFRFVGGVVIRR